MGEEKTEGVDHQEESAASAPADFSDEKNAENDASPGKALAPTETDCEVGETEGSVRTGVTYVALAQVEMEKRLALIKAWEENEKTKADNKAYKRLSTIDAWENAKRASIEAELKQIEENFEKKKAEYAEKMKNKVAMLHKEADEKRAMVEADKGKDFLMVEEAAAKFHATGNVPKKLFACFSC